MGDGHNEIHFISYTRLSTHCGKFWIKSHNENVQEGENYKYFIPYIYNTYVLLFKMQGFGFYTILKIFV